VKEFPPGRPESPPREEPAPSVPICVRRRAGRLAREPLVSREGVDGLGIEAAPLHLSIKAIGVAPVGRPPARSVHGTCRVVVARPWCLGRAKSLRASAKTGARASLGGLRVGAAALCVSGVATTLTNMPIGRIGGKPRPSGAAGVGVIVDQGIVAR
jgi:hypothetical protein